MRRRRFLGGLGIGLLASTGGRMAIQPRRSTIATGPRDRPARTVLPRRVVVVGGGLAGMAAASDLASLGLAVTLAVALVAAGALRAESVYMEPVEARVIASSARVQGGTPVTIGVLFRVQRGWHVYWLNPGESGLATSVRWTLPEGYVAGPLRWPLPERFEQQGGAVGYGYADALLLSSVVTPPAGAREAVPVRAQVGWLACEKICLRGTRTLELTLGPDTPRAAVDPAVFDTWTARLPMDAGAPDAPATLRARGEIPRGGQVGTVVVTVSWRAAPAAVEWFPPDDQSLEVEAAESRSRDRRTVLTFRARRLPDAAPGPRSLESVLTWRDGEGVRRGLRIPVDLEGGSRP